MLRLGVGGLSRAPPNNSLNRTRREQFFHRCPLRFGRMLHAARRLIRALGVRNALYFCKLSVNYSLIEEMILCTTNLLWSLSKMENGLSATVQKYPELMVRGSRLKNVVRI